MIITLEKMSITLKRVIDGWLEKMVITQKMNITQKLMVEKMNITLGVERKNYGSKENK